ncbi:MAG: 16S rRNA (adenine1518-N6/adenine1519-N6)-dimethyltransferase [Flavobacteriales bacterium]|jgi:16S rRNA (adenine1518-N6/adenine1519-N6)-dimethyltransferase
MHDLSPGPHRARKRFGQNFLVDTNVIQLIAKSVNAKADESLVEIGPGQGALTALLLNTCPTLQAVELDRDLVPILNAHFAADYPDFTIHQADALKFDFSELARNGKGAKLRVVGNLPYNISTPLMFKLLGYDNLVEDMHFMLQKEVVDRLAASPGAKLYGRLGVMAQYACRVEHLFDVAPGSFRPIPKVNSAIVKLVPYTELPHKADNPQLFEQLVRLGFQQRRKTMRNALKTLVKGLNIEALDVDLSLRAETLSVANFVNLSNQINQQLCLTESE